MTVLLRFAPSPTGPLHLGGLRTALINHLYSRSHGGKWILRIEDTDATRYDANSLDDIRKSLEWAGLDYDFGPNRDGPHRPYFQSQRRDLYLNYAHKLLDSGHAYRCFCSPDRLVTTRAELSKRGLPSTYDRHCTKLTEEEVARRVRNAEQSIIRLNLEKVPVRKSIKDLVFGDFTDGHGSLPTDPVIVKSDLNPTYHLASVVDDHEMRISHVFRGEEWLTSLPLHLDLYAALNLNPPHFAHLPLLLNNDGSKMSKRHGDARVSEYIAKNFERDALLSWLAYAGWGTAGAEKENEISFYEPLPVESLIKKFDGWHPINRRTTLDQKRLSALNRRDIQRQSKIKAGMKELKLRVEEVMSKHFTYIVNHHEQDYEHLIELAAGRVNNIEEFPSLFGFLYEEPSFKTPEGDANKRLYRQTILNLLALLNSKRPETREDYEAVLKELLEMSWAEQKTTFPIIRYVLTGHKNGVGVLDILCLTGFDKLVARLGSAADAIDSVSPDAPESLATSDI